MNCNKHSLTLGFLFLFLTTYAQDYIKDQIPQNKTYTAAEVMDDRYGIVMYEPLNLRLGGDSIRNDHKGYSVKGWIDDFYADGSKLHKGYYVDGMLKIYKNFYPNGNVERDFKNIDDYRSNMKIYYADGRLKTQVKYYKDAALFWEDYYENGNLEYQEEYHKSGSYYLNQNSYYQDGKAESSLILDNKKKLRFLKKEFYDNGQIKTQGQLYYSTNEFDYLKYGKWYYYDKEGRLIKEEEYEKGKLSAEKSYN